MKTVTKIDVITAPVDEVKRLRVAAYCRVSTDSDAQLESLEAQKSHYEQYISRHPEWELAGIYYDEGISGTKKEKRPELLRLIADCEAGRIDYIVTKSISRLARNTTDSLEIVRKLNALSIPIFFEKENFNTGDMDGAIGNLSKVADAEDQMAQNAALHIGLAALNKKDNDMARIWFERASSLPGNPSVREQALYNYAMIMSIFHYLSGKSNVILKGFGRGIYHY